MYLLLSLIISSAFCIEVEKDCEKKWNADYMSHNVQYNHLVIIDMSEADETNNLDCFYRLISERGIPTVTLKNNNGSHENVNQAQMDALKKSYLYRTSSISFIILMPHLNGNDILHCKYYKILRRYPKALITFVFYKNGGLLSRPEFEGISYYFINFVLINLKFMKPVGIVLDSTGAKYFTYDVDKLDDKSYACGVKFSENNFDHELLTEQSRKLIENYPVRITMFHRVPTAISSVRHGWVKFRSCLMVQLLRHKFFGKDGLLIADIIDHLKFKPVYVGKPGIEPFGRYSLNGTVSGVLADIIKQNIEISSNSRFITAYGVENDYYFLGYNHFDRLCALVPKSKKLPIWIQVLRTYSTLIWTILNAVVTLISFLRWIHFNLIKKRRLSLFNVFLETYFSLIVPVNNFCHSPHRILLAVNLIISIIFVPIFQGNIRSAYTKRNNYPSIDSLELLDRYFDRILLPYMDQRLVFSGGINDLYDRLDRKVESGNLDYLRYLDSIPVDQEFPAIIVPEADSRVMLNFIHDAANKVYLVKECPREYLYSFISSTDFPWADEVELTTLRLVAAGLPAWYYRMTESTIRLITNHHIPDSIPRFQPLSLYLVSGPFYVFATGVILSLMVFWMEIAFSSSNTSSSSTVHTSI